MSYLQEQAYQGYSAQATYALHAGSGRMYHSQSHRLTNPGSNHAGDSRVYQYIAEVFRHLFNRQFPESINVCFYEQPAFEMASRRFGHEPAEGLLGFAVNKNDGTSHVFCRSGSLEEELLTAGHEAGHVLTKTIRNRLKEEAKATAFSLAWLQTIRKHNIGNMRYSARLPQPAANGLHDAALALVERYRENGMEPLAIFSHLVNSAAYLE